MEALCFMSGLVGGIAAIGASIVIAWFKEYFYQKRERLHFLVELRSRILNADYYVVNTLINKMQEADAEVEVQTFGMYVNKLETMMFEKYIYLNRKEMAVFEKIRDLMLSFQQNAMCSTLCASRIKQVEGLPAKRKFMLKYLKEQARFVSQCYDNRNEWKTQMSYMEVLVKRASRDLHLRIAR